MVIGHVQSSDRHQCRRPDAVRGFGRSTTHTRDVATSIALAMSFYKRNLVVGLAKDGMTDSAPLARIVAKYVTPEILEAIASEFAKGRVLEIGTTDLDAGRPVTWNMGAIASSKAPGALELFRKIMIASTSIPGAVSPVMIDVKIGGKRYQEMHVDGGVITQVFTYPPNTVMELMQATASHWAVRCTCMSSAMVKLEPEWRATKRRTLSIGSARSMHCYRYRALTTYIGSIRRRATTARISIWLISGRTSTIHTRRSSTRRT
jgi:predicted acylesterase/phospholipase RssA